MRILFLTQFFWPEVRTAPMNLADMAEDLQARGHEVTVVTGFPNHPFGRIYEGYRQELRKWDEVRGVKVLRLPLFPDHSRSLWRRALNYGSFMLSAMTLGAYLTRNIQADVIFAYFAPLTIGVAAALFKRLHGAPVIYWVTDFWPENLSASGISVRPRMYSVLRRVEAWAYGRADVICAASPGFARNLVEKGVSADRIQTLLPWVDENFFYPAVPDEDLSQQYGFAGKFNVVYGGNLGPVQELGTVVEAARLVQDLEDVRFVFIGDGTAEDKLKRQVAEYQLRNVCFIPRQPPEEIHRFFVLADLLLVHLKREPVYELQLPSKVVAYLACGRPILSAVSGVVEQIVLDAGAGLVCPPEDPRAMARQVRALYELPKNEREAMGRRGRQVYLENYTRSVQLDRIEKVLAGVAAEA